MMSIFFSKPFVVHEAGSLLSLGKGGHYSVTVGKYFF